MENVLLIDGRDIRESGRIANAFGDCKLSWISGADVGAMAASLLANPDLASERVIVAGGVEQLTYAQVAETIASVVSRPVIYEEVTSPAWREKLIAASTERGEPNIRGAEHLVASPSRCVQGRRCPSQIMFANSWGVRPSHSPSLSTPIVRN